MCVPPHVPAIPNPQELTKCVAMGAAYGTAKSGIGIAGVGTYRPDLIMKVLPLVLRLWRGMVV